MARLSAVTLVLLLAANPLHTSLAAVGGGCGEAAGPVDVSEDNDWISSKRPLFILDDAGRLWRGDLRWEKPVLVSDHGFGENPHAERSADGRFVIYGGDIAGRSVRQWWLFDLLSGKERLALEVPSRRSGLPTFSPDGKWISIHFSSAWLKPGDKLAGLHLISTADGEHLHIGDVPSPPLPSGGRAVSELWAADGKSLAFIAFDADNRRLFVEYGPLRNGTWSQVDDEDPKETLNPRISRGGVKIPLAEEEHMPSHVLYSTRKSEDGRWIASVDAKHRLEISGPGEERRHLATGAYDECMGVNIGINGWFDNRYLIYSLDRATYLADAESGRQIRLFEADEAYYYFW